MGIVRIQAFCPSCGVLCASEEKEVTKNLFEKGKYHANLVCWSCKKALPEITILVECELR